MFKSAQENSMQGIEETFSQVLNLGMSNLYRNCNGHVPGQDGFTGRRTDEPKKGNFDNSKPIQNALRIHSGRLPDKPLIYQHNRRQIIEPEQSMQFCANNSSRIISRPNSIDSDTIEIDQAKIREEPIPKLNRSIFGSISTEPSARIS
jgi:hypothetical protein